MPKIKRPADMSQQANFCFRMIQKSEKVRKAVAGFTLIELLIVIVIIGIVTTIATISAGDFNQKRRLRLEAELFLETLRYAQYYAVLTPIPLRIQLDHQKWQWQAYRPEKGWRSLNQLAFSKKFPKHLKLIQPQSINITISPSGRIHPFNILLGNRNHQFQITSDHDLSIKNHV